MKLKSVMIYAVSGLLAATFAYASPVLADDANNDGQSASSAQSDQNQDASSDSNTTSDNNSNNMNNNNNMNTNDRNNDQNGTPDTATGSDDDY